MTTLDELLTPEQAHAVELIRSTLGADPAADSKFWEHLLGHMLAGTVTPDGAAHDLDLQGARVEVKFSREFQMLLGNQRRSNVFRWAGLSGHGRRLKDATSTVLVGLDRSRDVWFWVIPAAAIGTTRVVTCVVPSDRTGLDRAALDSYRTDPGDILGRCLHYDRDHHAETARATRDAAQGQGTLL